MRILSVLIVTIIALFAWNAFAQGARNHFLAGQDYYAQGRYQKAIEEFDEAYQLDPKPLLLYNIAQSYEKLGNLPKAIEYIKRYLQEDPKTSSKSSLQSKIKILEQRMAATGITVQSNVDGAEIFVDDKSVGTTPLDGVIPLPVGTHKVRVSKDGFGDFRMHVAISSGHSVPVEAALEARAETPTAVEPATTEEVSEEEPEDRKDIEVLDVVPWAIAGVGAAAAITGLAVIGSMAKSQDDHDLAVVADAIGWPGLALAVGGGIWGIIRIMSGKSSESEGTESDQTTFLVVPFAQESRLGVAATISF